MFSDIFLLLFSPIALQIGQLIKDPRFTLFEAVGALEVCKNSCAIVHKLRQNLIKKAYKEVREVFLFH